MRGGWRRCLIVEIVDVEMGRVNDEGGGVVSSITRRTVMVAAATATTRTMTITAAMDKVKNTNITSIIINTDTFSY